MGRQFFSVALAWFFPGVGHILQNRTKTGIIIAITFVLMFAIGVANGGLDYPGTSTGKDSFLLYLLNIFARMGNGLGYLVFLFFGNTSPETAARTTFEYGGRLIEIAGLLNYLAVLNCLDIASGKK
jgi:hypothetical protein